MFEEVITIQIFDKGKIADLHGFNFDSNLSYALKALEFNQTAGALLP